MKAIRCQKHHREHSKPFQVFPFCVKLQSHKCWKHCSYWVLSEVPIFQRDPPVPIEIHGAACGKSVQMLVWIRCGFSQKWFSVLSSWQGALFEGDLPSCQCGRAAPPWALGRCEGPKPQGWFREHSQGSPQAAASQGITLQLRAAVGEEGINNPFVSTAPCCHYPAFPSSPSVLSCTAVQN